MAIFKQAAPLPIEHSAISQGLDFMPDDNSSINKFTSMTPKDKIIDELDRVNFNVSASGTRSKEYEQGFNAAITLSINLINKFLK